MLTEVTRLTRKEQVQFKAWVNSFLGVMMKITKRPESDWEHIEADDNIVRPKKEPKPKPGRKQNAECKRPKIK